MRLGLVLCPAIGRIANGAVGAQYLTKVVATGSRRLPWGGWNGALGAKLRERMPIKATGPEWAAMAMLVVAPSRIKDAKLGSRRSS